MAPAAPARHAAIDERRIAREAGIGPDPQPLGNAGPHPLDEGIRVPGKAQHGIDGFGLLEVEDDGLLAALGDLRGTVAGRCRGTLDADHLGAQVGEQHCAERPRAYPRDLENPDALQDPHSHPVPIPATEATGRSAKSMDPMNRDAASCASSISRSTIVLADSIASAKPPAGPSETMPPSTSCRTA